MARHVRENNQGADRRANQLDDHAARASELLRNRTQERRAGAQYTARPQQGVRQPASPSRPSVQSYPKGLGEYFNQNKVYILAVVATVLVVIAGIFAVRALLPSEEPVGETGYVSPYDWSKLDHANGRYRYVVNGQVKSRLGVDVSDYQHDIDWNAVAADGIDFAMIRLGRRGTTEGKLYLDDEYQANIKGARNAGLDCGVYFFSQAITVEEALEEADFVLTNLNGTKLEYGVLFDSEAVKFGSEPSRTTSLSNDEMTAIAEAFCNRIEAGGYHTYVYGNAADLARFDYDTLKQHDIWWAQYEVSHPTETIDISVWQYSEAAQVDGIEGGIDLNIDLSSALD